MAHRRPDQSIDGGLRVERTESVLVEQEVGEWMELPLWLHDARFSAMLQTPVDRALAAGLRIRPLEETARDTLEWVRAGLAPSEPDAGLDRAKERRVLDAWASKG